MYEIITCNAEFVNKIVKENDIDKLAEKHIKSVMRDEKKAASDNKKTVKDMIDKKRIDIKEIQGIRVTKEGGTREYSSKEASEFLDKDKYPLLSIYLTLNENGYLIEREIMSQFNKELGELKRVLRPLLKQSIEKSFPYSDKAKKKALKFLSEDKSISSGVSGVTDVPYGKLYDAVYSLFEFSGLAKKSNLDMIITYIVDKGVNRVYENLRIIFLDFKSIKSAIETGNYEYFETQIDECYEKEYQISLQDAKTELLKGPLSGAIAQAIIGEAESRNYKSAGFIDEDQFACMAIEWYSKELGTDWNELASKELGKGDVRRFNHKNAEKILKILKQMKENPGKTVNNVNRLLAENFICEYKMDEQWITQILNQIIEVVEEAVNKNLELVICQTYK